MARKTVTITGDDKAIRMLLAKGTAGAHLRPEMEQLAWYSEDQITRVPIDTGRLARSLSGGTEQYLETTDSGFRLGTTVPYARYVVYKPGAVRVNKSAIAREATTVINHRIAQERG